MRIEKCSCTKKVKIPGNIWIKISICSLINNYTKKKIYQTEPETETAVKKKKIKNNKLYMSIYINIICSILLVLFVLSL